MHWYSVQLVLSVFDLLAAHEVHSFLHCYLQPLLLCTFDTVTQLFNDAACGAPLTLPIAALAFGPPGSLALVALDAAAGIRPSSFLLRALVERASRVLRIQLGFGFRGVYCTA